MQKSLLLVSHPLAILIMLFVGLPNATEVSSSWDIDPPDPRDYFDEENN